MRAARHRAPGRQRHLTGIRGAAREWWYNCNAEARLCVELHMNMHEFLKNRLKFPPNELLKYEGKYVAWSPDGKAILASDDDELRLGSFIRSAGYDTAEVLITFVPPADEVVLGGGGAAP